MDTFSNQQIKQYNDDGFFVAKKLFSNDEITNISSWIDELVVRAPRIGKEMYYYEDDLRRPGEKILNCLETISELDGNGIVTVIHDWSASVKESVSDQSWRYSMRKPAPAASENVSAAVAACSCRIIPVLMASLSSKRSYCVSSAKMAQTGTRN